MEYLSALGVVILSGLGGGAGLLLAAYLGRSLLAQLFAKELESFKGDIQRDLEGVRREMRVQAHEREIRFSRWHERQLDVLIGLYGHLAEAHRAAERMHMTSYFSLGQSPVTDPSFRACEQIREHLRQQRLFVPDDLADKVSDVVDELSNTLLGLSQGTITREDSGRTTHALALRLAMILGEVRGDVQRILAGPPTGPSQP